MRNIMKGLIALIPLVILAEISLHKGDGLRITYSPKSMHIDTVYFDNQQYAEFFSDNSILFPYQDEGDPALHSRLFEIGIPIDSDFDYEIIDVQYETYSGVDIVPLFPLINTEQEDFTPSLSNTYRKSEMTPDSWLLFDGYRHIRGQRIARLLVPIVRYNPSTSSIEYLKKIDFVVRYDDIKSSAMDSYDKHFEALFKSNLINYQEAREYRYDWQGQTRAIKRLSENPFDNELSWWKVRFKNTGIYRISYEELISEGIITSSTRQEEIHFYSALPEMLPTPPGIPLPELIRIGAYYRDNGDGHFGPGDSFLIPLFGPWGSILETGVGFRGYANYYDTLNTMWIAVGTQLPKRADIIDIETASHEEINSGWTYSYQKQENRVNYGINQESWYWGEYERFSVYITDPSRANNDLDVNLFIRYDPPVSSFTLNGEPLDMNMDNNFANPTRSVYGGKLAAISSNIEGRYLNEVNFQSYEYAYNIHLMPRSGRLRFASFSDSLLSDVKRFNLQGFSEKPFVFDITDFESSRMLFVREDGDGYYFIDTLNNREYLAVTNEGIMDLTGQFTSYSNFSLRDESRGADMVVITPKHFNLQDYAQHRASYSDMTVEIVHLEDIFREFGYGNPDPTAVREFLRYAYYFWDTPPSYAIAIGDAHFDVFNKLTSKKIQFPVPLGADRNTDVFFGSFAPGESQIMVGRWPVNSQREVDIVTNKIIEYETGQNFGLWRRRIITSSDDEFVAPNFESFRHILNQSELWEIIIPCGYDPVTVYPVEFPLNAFNERPDAADYLVSRINEGALAVNYSGHGSAIRWAHESVLKLERDIPRLRNSDRLPFVSSFSCFVAKYYLDWTECIAEELLRKRDGGAIATLASPWGSFGSQNRNYNRNLYSNLFNSDIVMTIGQASYASKAGLYPHHDSQYIIFGDPSMKLAHTRYYIDFTMPDTLRGGELFEVSGRVVDGAANTVNSFNGRIRLKARDSHFMKFYTTTIPSALGNSCEYWQAGKMIFEGEATVRDGEFQIAFIVPNSVSDSTFAGSVLGYAYSDNYDAVGCSENLAVFRGDADTTDREGPHIEVYFNSIQGSADRICQNTNLLVMLQDDNGIDITGSVGRKILLILDRDNLTQIDLTRYFRYDDGSYTSGIIEYALEGLSIGNHTATIIASDNLGNTSSIEIDFEVNDCEDGLFDVLPYPSPFVDNCYFTFGLGTQADIEITIFTQTGRRLRRINDTVSGPFAKIFWDGRDENGNAVANGTYIYHISAGFENSNDSFTGKIAKIR